MDDLISREAAIAYSISGMTREIDGDKWIRVSEVRENIKTMPSAQPERKNGKWTTEQVAELLANMFGEECACDFNGIDEWLPSACKYSETTCPNPKEKHGCWMQFLIQGGADMRGDCDEKPM